MAVLGRVNFAAQQRVDLHHMLMMESFTAFDFRSIVANLVGTDGTYVVRGLRVIGVTGLTIQVETQNSQVFNPLDNNGSFYVGQSTDAPISVDLPANQANIYVEATFTNESEAPVNTAFWDPLALSGDSASGTEFSASTNTQNVLVLNISVNTVGFSADAIPLVYASTNASAVTAMQDRRPLLYRLGTGGASPNPLSQYTWSTNRGEPVPSGTGVGDDTNSPWQARDSVGAINDKAFESFKDWADAVMTRISEISGSPLWYEAGLSTSPVSDVSLNEVFFDTLGHSPVATESAAWIWKQVSGNLCLCGEGNAPIVSGSYQVGLVKWQSNYGNLNWQLGGVFANSTFRNYSTLQFASPAPDDSGNVYLLLEREVPKGSGAAVVWASNTAQPAFIANQSVSGQAGDFTGIALGDYIRKESEGYSRYYQVTKMSDGTIIYDNAVSSNTNRIADSTIICLQLESVILGNASTEPLRYFRARYSNADLYADQNIATNGYIYQGADFYWLGRRSGQLFYLRNYGDLQENEETQVLNEQADSLTAATGDGGLALQHAQQAIYSTGAGYSLKSGSGNLITIYRRARNNTVGIPVDGSDNSGSLLTYTIAAPVGTMTVGQNLWVRLSDTTSGALTAGVVTNPTDDEDLTDVTTNQYQILSAANSPLRTFHNRDVFLLARCMLIDGETSLVFSDGSVIGAYGNLINQDTELTNNVKLTARTSKAILFISGTIPGQIDDDGANFMYNKAAGTFTAFNFAFNNNNTLSQPVPSDVTIFSNLGAHTLTVGQSTSTTIFPGDVIIQGTSTAITTASLTVTDKEIIVGVGNLNNGGGGSGIGVADNTQQPTNIATTNGQDYVDLTYSAAHGYVVGNVVWVVATAPVGGITAGEISGSYTVASSGTTVGTATITSSTVIRIYTSGDATSTASITSGVDTFLAPSSILMTNASGSTGGMTSWAFAVKDATTAPTLTPVNSYGIVPTANSVDFVRTRVPFAAADGAGPAGVDSTLDFSSQFTWNNTTDTLSVTNLSAGSSTITTFNVTTLNVTGQEYFTNLATLSTPPPVSNEVCVFAYGDIMFQRNQYGETAPMAMLASNVYNEAVDVVATPSGNNQMAAILSPPVTVTLPKDSKRYVGATLTASTDGTTSTVTVKKEAHGMSSGDLITVVTSTAIGGISAVNLSVTSVAITVTGVNTFTYHAGAASTSAATGSLDTTYAFTARSYIVGDRSLQVFQNGVLLRNGIDYNEVGVAGATSNTVTLNFIAEITNVITYRIAAVGGIVLVTGGNASGTLQAAYNAGQSIAVNLGAPIVITGPSGMDLLQVNGNMTVTGVIDPAGITFTPQSSNPLASGEYGLWFDASGNIIYTRNGQSDFNLTQAISSGNSSLVVTYPNGSGSVILSYSPVSFNTNGMEAADVTTEANALAISGVTSAQVNNATSGSVVTHGTMQNVTIAGANPGDIIYAAIGGGLTNVKPSIGVAGFMAGDFIVKIGTVVKNVSNPSKIDLIVNIQLVGQL